MKSVLPLRTILFILGQHTLGMLGLSCYILADTFFVANRLGADGLAALNLAIPLGIPYTTGWRTTASFWPCVMVSS